MDQDDLTNELDVAALLQDLRKLHADIPMFATWRIERLERILWHYIQILHEVAAFDEYRESCVTLLQALPEIMEQKEMACETQHWSHFNRCSIALGWDMEALITILSGGDRDQSPNATGLPG